MFFGAAGRQRKIDGLLTAANEHVASGNFADARKAAEEAFEVAAKALGDHVAAAPQALSIIVHCAVKVGDWPHAQAVLERGLSLFETQFGHDDSFTFDVRRSLLDIYERRENHDGVLRVAREALAHISDQHPEHPILRALSAGSLAALGRIDEAVEIAMRAFEDAGARFEMRTEATSLTAWLLARMLISTGRDPVLGLRVLGECRLEGLPQTLPQWVAFLRDSDLQAQAHLKLGEVHEAAHYLDQVTKFAFKPVWEMGGYPRLLYGKLEALYGEAEAALGNMEKAESRVRGAIRDVETTAGPRSAELIPMLESYARVLRTRGDVRNAEVQEKRAAAIRTLITGKRSAAVKQEPWKPVTRVWPRRTLAGVFHLRNVSPSILANMIASMRPVSPDDIGFEAIPISGDQAFIVLNSWDKVWQPAIALVAKNYLAALGSIIRLINTGVAAGGGKPVEIEPWAAVRDEIACGWQEWPPEDRQTLVREVFPALPVWTGDETTPRWLGEGILLKDGRPMLATPAVNVSFLPNNSIGFAGIGPASMLDQWFVAFARATRLFPAETYSKLSAAAPDAPPLTGATRTARA